METWRPLSPPMGEKCYSRVKIYCLKQTKANHQKVTVQKTGESRKAQNLQTVHSSGRLWIYICLKDKKAAKELLYLTFSYHQLTLKIPYHTADSSDQDSKVRHHLKTFLFSLLSLQRRMCLKEENQTARKRRGEDTREDRWMQKEHLIPDKFKMLGALSMTALRI